MVVLIAKARRRKTSRRRRDGCFFKRQGAKARRRKELWGAAPLPYKARIQGTKHQQSPDRGGT